jgi:1,4-alpha-glucan branching enzyme
MTRIYYFSCIPDNVNILDNMFSLTIYFFSIKYKMVKGYCNFILHSHLPWVLGHGRWPHGTDWLNEAAAECYIPLLDQIIRLIENGYHPHLNIGITPILQEQLQSPIFINEFVNYLQNKIEAADKDISEFSRKRQMNFLAVAEMWKDYYIKINNIFKKNFRNDLIKVFSNLQKQGYVEIITSAATHGYLPLLKYDRSVNAQIGLGINVYSKNFNKVPHGIWLPECAYRPPYKWKPPIGPDTAQYLRKGIDEFLGEHNIEYFVIDAHLLKGGKAIGVYLTRFKALKNLWQHFRKESIEIKEEFEKSPHDIYLVASNPHIRPVAVFTRDPETALQVWSGELGYPGEAKYLDFHKKRFPGGLRYWRVTNPKIDLAQKEIYAPDDIEYRVKEHAQHFVSLIKNVSTNYYKEHNRPALICAPFDAELFGHWWFEGPRWLYHVFKYLEENTELDTVTGTMMLNTLRPDKVVSLPEGSWGEGGFHYIWLNQSTEWTWRKIYEAEDEFYKLYDKFSELKDKNIISILKQMGRELLLLQSSDWQFLISTRSARDYAELRFSRHFENFKKLGHILDNYMRDNKFENSVKIFLDDLYQQDNCFKDLNLSIFKS